MGITVYQINVRNWKSNKYALSVDIHNYNPDIILLNETSVNPNDAITLDGFQSITKSNGAYSGVGVLIKNTLKFKLIHVVDTNTIAIQLQTDIGPVIISTSYCPPRQKYIPTTSIYSILPNNLPTIFISDYNAHHPVFDNCYIGQPSGDNKGKILANLMELKRLKCLGPPFSTYIMNKKRGKPDVIIVNHLFLPYHYTIIPGNNIGSDHIPIIFKFNVKPYKQLIDTTKTSKSSIFKVIDKNSLIYKFLT